ncbi:hypothetical protein OIU77_010477 [Salix suchowensis]|uniref:Uncharacterized protein n=1 Tax=Salix suchowensis TaxID=1278906 RepID=A0ABQ9A9L7_9ROSI|nr:hypothetical protein OIU77_010477 [Salix suchowensis]
MLRYMFCDADAVRPSGILLAKIKNRSIGDYLHLRVSQNMNSAVDLQLPIGNPISVYAHCTRNTISVSARVSDGRN